MHKYILKILLLVSFLIVAPMSTPLAQKNDGFSVAMPGWTYQPKSQIRDLKLPGVPEFQGLLNRRKSGVLTPSIYVLKQSMPNLKNENLETWLIHKYLKDRGTLSHKGPFKTEHHQGYIHVFSSTSGPTKMINVIYSFQMGHELVLLSQTTVAASFKTDHQTTNAALKHIKLIK